MIIFTPVEALDEEGNPYPPGPTTVCCKPPVGVWLMTTPTGTEAGYVEQPQVRTFSSSTGINSIEGGLPVNDDLTKVQLQDIAAQFGLSTSGLKAEILQRILDHLGVD